MPRYDDDWDEPDEDWDGDDWGDDDDDLDDTIPCPYCHEPIHEDAQRCPHCEHYISAEDAPPARKPWWIILGVGICLLVVYLWITSGL